MGKETTEHAQVVVLEIQFAGKFISGRLFITYKWA